MRLCMAKLTRRDHPAFRPALPTHQGLRPGQFWLVASKVILGLVVCDKFPLLQGLFHGRDVLLGLQLLPVGGFIIQLERTGIIVLGPVAGDARPVKTGHHVNGLVDAFIHSYPQVDVGTAQ